MRKAVKSVVFDVTKLTPGQSRWHVGGNLFHRFDKQAIGVAYGNMHAFGLYFSISWMVGY